MQFKILLTGVALLFATSVNAHLDGATPYWYPTTYLYGFVQGCWETVEQNQSLAEGMWPDDIRAVCGCVVDAIDILSHFMRPRMVLLRVSKSLMRFQLVFYLNVSWKMRQEL